MGGYIAPPTHLGTCASLDIAGQEKLRTQNASALRAWRTLYGNAAVAAVDVLFVGDSRFEGQNATPTIDSRTISLAVTQMRAARGVSGGRGYIPSWYGISAPTGQGPTSSGTVTQQQNFGFGKRNVSLATSTANKQTYSFTGTSFKVLYAGGTATGHLGVSIDGGSVTDVDTVQGTTTDGLTSTSAALSPGAHTVDVSWQSGGQVLIDGLFAFDGDEDGNGGVRLWDGAHFGFRSASFSPFGTAAWTNCIPAITNLGLVVISLMTNDEIAVSSAQYKTDMLALIAGIKAKASSSAPPSYLLLCDWERGDATAKVEPHANYVQAVYDIVAADPTLALLDLTRRMVVAPDAYGTYNADKVHETGVGHRLKSDILATFLTGGV